MRKKLKKPFGSKLKLARGTRLTSFLFIATSIAVAAGILWAANMYYNIDTGEVVMEEIQRVTQTIRAVGGLIVGGTDSQNPSSGYTFEVVGKTKLATTTVATGPLELTAADQELRFTGGTGYYIGLKAPTNVTSTKVYTLPQHGTSPPSSDYVLTWQTGDQLEWKQVSNISGAGDITAVGDVASGDAFTSSAGTSYGNTLWFHPDTNYTMALTAQSGLTANATTVIPAISGTNYLTLAASFPFSQGQVLYADSNGLITGGNDLQFDASGRILTIGSSANAGQLRIYSSNASGYYLGFAATSTMTANTLYYWPTDTGSSNQVLTTDGSGQLAWSTVAGVGGVTGTGTAGQVAYWDGTSSITGDTDFQWDDVSNVLTITGQISVPTLTSSGALTITSGGTSDITINPGSGKVVLGSSDYIQTASGYEIGKAGKQILREMIPIMGFDLPAQCSTACDDEYAQISRTIEDYPFASAYTGTTRKHKFVIRYATSDTTNTVTFRVYNETNSTTTDSFTVPASPSTDLAKGVVEITSDVTIPTDGSDWHLDVQGTTGLTVKIYQVFLAAYDQID